MKKILVQFNLPGVTLQTYDQVWTDLRAAGHANPVGLLHHVGAMNGNTLIVTDTWESPEAFEKFGGILGPLLAKHGVADIPPTVLPVHYEYKK